MNPLFDNKSPKDRRRKATAFGLVIIGSAAILLAVFLVIRFWAPWNRQTPVPAPSGQIVDIKSATAEPQRLLIPNLNIDAPFVRLGLNPDQTLEVPKGDGEVGWFVYGAKPGDVGPAVVVGHLDSVRGPAVFANLHSIKAGDIVKIVRVDGSQVTYRVDSISKYSQDNFPTQAVYGPIDHAGLRLITCAGTYNQTKGRYSDNLIVYGTLVM